MKFWDTCEEEWSEGKVFYLPCGKQKVVMRRSLACMGRRVSP
jgi:hypothetical protein